MVCRTPQWLEQAGHFVSHVATLTISVGRLVGLVTCRQVLKKVSMNLLVKCHIYTRNFWFQSLNNDVKLTFVGIDASNIRIQNATSSVMSAFFPSRRCSIACSPLLDDPCMLSAATKRHPPKNAKRATNVLVPNIIFNYKQIIWELCL